MGKGNVCVHNDYEGLYYIDYGYFNHDEDIDESIDIFKEDFKKRFNSFTECDEWLERDTPAILENELFYIAVEDNEWSMAIMLIQKEQGYYWDGSIEGLQKKHYQTYLNGIKECLFNQFETLGVYGGAWTSGTIKRRNENEK